MFHFGQKVEGEVYVILRKTCGFAFWKKIWKAFVNLSILLNIQTLINVFFWDGYAHLLMQSSTLALLTISHVRELSSIFQLQLEAKQLVEALTYCDVSTFETLFDYAAPRDCSNKRLTKAVDRTIKYCSTILDSRDQFKVIAIFFLSSVLLIQQRHMLDSNFFTKCFTKKKTFELLHFLGCWSLNERSFFSTLSLLIMKVRR